MIYSKCVFKLTPNGSSGNRRKRVCVIAERVKCSLVAFFSEEQAAAPRSNPLPPQEMEKADSANTAISSLILFLSAVMIHSTLFKKGNKHHFGRLYKPALTLSMCI